MNKRIHFLCSVIAVCCLLLMATLTTRAQAPSGNDTIIWVTTDSSWTVPEGVTSVTFECWGAGGAGGSAYNRHGDGGAAGGGGGAYAKKTITTSTGQVFSITVGKGGKWGPNIINNTKPLRWNGGSSYVVLSSSTIVKAAGGGTARLLHRDSLNAYEYEAKGGQSIDCIGDVKNSGGNGGRGFRWYASINKGCWSGGGGAAAGPSGNGQTAYRTNLYSTTPYAGQATYPSGSGGDPVHLNEPSNTEAKDGNPGNKYGGGGSGAHSGSTTLAYGGVGANGLVRISYQKPDPCATMTPGNLNLSNWRCSGVPASSFAITINSTADATPAGGTYSWQKYNAGTSVWESISGTTSELVVSEKGTFRRVYTVTGCPISYTTSVDITSHPTDVPVGTVEENPTFPAPCVGDVLTSLSLKANTSRTETIQWQKRVYTPGHPGIWEWTNQNTGDSYVEYDVTVRPLYNPRYRYFITLPGNECKLYSENTYTITPKMKPSVTLTTEPLCSGKLKATATVTNLSEVGGTATYTWSTNKTAGDFSYTVNENTLTVDKILQCPVVSTVSVQVTGTNGCTASVGPKNFDMSLETPYSSYYNSNGNRDTLVVTISLLGQYIYNERDVLDLVLTHFNTEGNYCNLLGAVAFSTTGCLADGAALDKDTTISVRVYSEDCSPAGVSDQVIQVFIQTSCATAMFADISETLCSPQKPLNKTFIPTSPPGGDLRYTWTVLSTDASITGANANSTPAVSFSETNLSNNGLADATVVYMVAPIEVNSSGDTCYGLPFKYSVTLKPSISNADAITYDNSDVTATLYYGACDTALNIATPDITTTITEWEDQLVITNNAHLLPIRLAPGTYVVTWTVTDPCGGKVIFDRNYIVEYPACGMGVTVTDVDGNTYETVRIGCECWTKSNLKATKYSDGTTVPFAMGYHSLERPDTEENIANFGLLYTWYSAVNVPEGDNTAVPATTTDPISGYVYVPGVCPEGWALPSTANLQDVTNRVADVSGLKSTDQSKWLPGAAGTDALGFSAVAAGYYDPVSARYLDLLGEAFFWSHDTHTATESSCLTVAYYCEQALYQDKVKGMGYSVRCVKRANP